MQKSKVRIKNQRGVARGGEFVLLYLYITRLAAVSRARATGGTRCGSSGVQGVGRVKPEHINTVVVPRLITMVNKL